MSFLQHNEIAILYSLDYSDQDISSMSYTDARSILDQNGYTSDRTQSGAGPAITQPVSLSLPNAQPQFDPELEALYDELFPLHGIKTDLHLPESSIHLQPFCWANNINQPRVHFSSSTVIKTFESTIKLPYKTPSRLFCMLMHEEYMTFLLCLNRNKRAFGKIPEELAVMIFRLVVPSHFWGGKVMDIVFHQAIKTLYANIGIKFTTKNCITCGRLFRITLKEGIILRSCEVCNSYRLCNLVGPYFDTLPITNDGKTIYQLYQGYRINQMTVESRRELNTLIFQTHPVDTIFSSQWLLLVLYTASKLWDRIYRTLSGIKLPTLELVKKKTRLIDYGKPELPTVALAGKNAFYKTEYCSPEVGRLINNPGSAKVVIHNRSSQKDRKSKKRVFIELGKSEIDLRGTADHFLHFVPPKFQIPVQATVQATVQLPPTKRPKTTVGQQLSTEAFNRRRFLSMNNPNDSEEEE
jgi:hypothetical protein